MAKEHDHVREIIKHTSFSLVAEGIKLAVLWSLPFVLAGLAVLAGYLQSTPWMYIISAATFVFATAATGALRISEWRSRITAQNKLIFQQIIPGVDFEKERKTGKIKWIKKAQLSIVLQNTAHFPMSYIVDELSTSFESVVNPKPQRDTNGAIIQPGTSGWYRDAPIDLKRMEINKNLFDAQIKFKIRYGFSSHEKHVIERNLKTVPLCADFQSPLAPAQYR